MVDGTEDGRCRCGSPYLIYRAASKPTSNKNAEVDSVGLARLDRVHYGGPGTRVIPICPPPSPPSDMRRWIVWPVPDVCVTVPRRYRPCPRDLVFHVFPPVST